MERSIRRSLLCLGLLAPLVMPFLAAGELKITDVSPSVVMLENDHGSNISCVALEDGLVFVDAGMSTEIARRFRQAMEARFERPAATLVLTHGHLDHFLGMAAFADLEVVAAERARTLFEHQLAVDFADERVFAAYAGVFKTLAEDYPAADPRLPGTWFSDELELGSGGNRLLIVNSGGHSTGSSWVYLARERVVVAGDLMQSHKHPYFGDPGTDLAAWIGAMASWQDQGVAAVCPGHGAVVDGSYIGAVVDYFELLRAKLAVLKGQGVSLEDAVSHPQLPAGYWPDDDPVPQWWPACIARAYLGVEAVATPEAAAGTQARTLDEDS